MRRLVTVSLACGIAVLAVAAAVDAVRGDETRREPKTEADRQTAPPRLARSEAPLATRTALVGRLERLGVAGTLYLSPDPCGGSEARPLRAISLPSLDRVEAPRWHGCGFSLSSDGASVAARGAAWQPGGALVATPERGTIELTSSSPAWRDRLEGSSPAFRPDGALTYVHDGEVLEWNRDCGRVDRSCPRTLLSRADLARAFRFDANTPSDTRFVSSYAVRELEWLSETRVAALLDASISFGPDHEQLLAVFEDREAIEGRPGLGGRFGPLSADPAGRHIAVRSGSRLDVLGPRAQTIWPSALEPVRAFAWSPDGRWLAVAGRASVYLVRTRDWTVLVSLPVATRDLAWR
jgi:WD40 repeat protein